MTKSKKLNLTERNEREKIIMELMTSDFLNKNGNSQSGHDVETPALSNGNGLDSGVSSPALREENSSSASSRRSSSAPIASASSEENSDSISSHAEEDNNPQEEKTKKFDRSEPKRQAGRWESSTKKNSSTEDIDKESSNSTTKDDNSQKEEITNQVPPVQNAGEEPEVEENENLGSRKEVEFPSQTKNKVSPGVIQVADIGIQEETNTDPSGQATKITDDDQTNVQMQSKEKEEEAAVNKQEAPDNNNNDTEVLSGKQPNNKNLHVVLAAGSAFLAIGCIVAGAMTSGLIGAGLFAMAAVFAIATAAELFLSSKLRSINVSPLVSEQLGKN